MVITLITPASKLSRGLVCLQESDKWGTYRLQWLWYPWVPSCVTVVSVQLPWHLSVYTLSNIYETKMNITLKYFNTTSWKGSHLRGLNLSKLDSISIYQLLNKLDNQTKTSWKTLDGVKLACSEQKSLILWKLLKQFLNEHL